jgi:hypothetical protein
VINNWRQLVSVDIRGDHYAYYQVGVIKKNGCFSVVQKHGCIGCRYPVDEGFYAMKVPGNSKGFGVLEEAHRYLDQVYSNTLHNNNRPYRRLGKYETLEEYERRVILVPLSAVPAPDYSALGM